MVPESVTHPDWLVLAAVSAAVVMRLSSLFIDLFIDVLLLVSG